MRPRPIQTKDGRSFPVIFEFESTKEHPGNSGVVGG
jgi:hypothetical protein